MKRTILTLTAASMVAGAVAAPANAACQDPYCPALKVKILKVSTQAGRTKLAVKTSLSRSATLTLVVTRGGKKKAVAGPKTVGAGKETTVFKLSDDLKKNKVYSVTVKAKVKGEKDSDTKKFVA